MTRDRITLVTITEEMVIKDGPNREALFDSLRLWKEGIKPVEFTLMEPNSAFQGEDRSRFAREHKLEARIFGIQPEDGSGHKWCLKVQFLDGRFVKITNSDPVDIYYCDGGGGYRRQGTVTDARPLADRPCVTKQGEIRLHGRVIGNVNDLPIAS